jgi:hypothetical protein
MFGCPDKLSPYHNKTIIAVVIEATIELHRGVALPRLKRSIEKLAKSGDDLAIRFSGTLALRIPEVGEIVDDGTKSALRAWLQKETSDHKGLAVKAAIKIGWWRQSALEAADTLSSKQISLVQDAPDVMVSRAARLYATAKDWGEANKLAAECVDPFIERFTVTDIDHIFSNARNGQADLIGSHSFSRLINGLYNNASLGGAAVEGLLDKHSLGSYKREES